MRPLSHVADRDDAIAFAAFHALVAPALRAAARRPLCRARHAGVACRAPAEPGGCADCEATIDDLLLDGFARLRSAVAGPIPATRSGEPVREMALLCGHLTSPQARDEDAAAFGRRLARAGGDDEPAWLRAARAQLVHYPLRHLEERVRRADAVRRGASARPDRDLRQAAWAAPLRADPAVLDMLVLAVFRVRRGVTEPFEVPDDLRDRHGLTRPDAARRMGEALRALRGTNPAFFAANIGEPPFEVPAAPVADPQERLDTAVDREIARASMCRLVSARLGDQRRRADRRTGYRAVIAAVCAVGAGRSGDPVAVATRNLGLAPRSARHLVRRLAILVAAAGVDWSEQLIRDATTGRSPI
ncbi:hypothetical protein [Actinomadura rupiterrae]|uniref:hypothetical protein n=1 Tax=Actinomadura rupiterrae TaxID=559627 RepID=UPI0020A56D5F|nr:hypothetical protein [Actinomadura rupiterrae]MCP2337968.1 hypothetical protein [Actinomadura rupiterrae]